MRTIEELDERLSRPSPALIEDLGRLDGDLIVLGAGGKLGPSLVRLALRGIEEARTRTRVIAVSRFSDPAARRTLEEAGADVIASDVSDADSLAALPDAENVVFLVGAKFGTRGHEAATWATNAFLPGLVAQRYRSARISALSTGNVYPLVPVRSGGSTEADDPEPVGEYAMSCLGRERVLRRFSETQGTPMSLIRLNYAVELRYGVLIDIAGMIADGEPVDLRTGFANVVWQGYANEVVLRALHRADSPPAVVNLTGPETVSIRRAATLIAEEMGKPVTFTGEESETALLADASLCHSLYGYPSLNWRELAVAAARWVTGGGERHGKPTKFQARDGRF